VDKYRLESDTASGLLRVIALRDFNNVKAGDHGGLVSGPDNLDQLGGCWVYEGSTARGNARVSGDARVYGRAQVCGNAVIAGNARIFSQALVFDRAIVFDNARVGGMAHVGGNAVVDGGARIFDAASISDNARVGGMAQLGGSIHICGNTFVRGTVFLFDAAYIGGNAVIASKEHYLYAMLSEGAVTMWRRSDGMLEGHYNGGISDLKEQCAADPELNAVVKIMKERAKNW